MLNRRNFLASTIATALAVPLATMGMTSPVQADEAKPAKAPGKGSKLLLIDSHVHVWKHDPKFPFAQGQKVPPVDASVEMLLALMQANGVSRTVLIQVIHYRWDNSYLASVLKRFPNMFKGVCRVNPEDPANADHLSRLTEEQGFHGVRLSPAATAQGDWIRGPLMAPLWRRCADLKVPMTILTAATRLPDLMPLIEQNPDLTVVIDHMADSPLEHPEQLSMLLALARYPKVYVKISHMWSLAKESYPYPDALDQVKRVIDAFGPKRSMWGTDWPICLAELPYDKAVELYRDHFGFLTRADHEQILHKTVQDVWSFGL
jgi:predicted TIM-barrel fold metal-dependent hydrolase